MCLSSSPFLPSPPHSRTPMKRFSYVQECYLSNHDGGPPRPKPCPPSSLSQSAATHRRTRSRRPRQPLQRADNLMPRDGRLQESKKPKSSRRLELLTLYQLSPCTAVTKSLGAKLTAVRYSLGRRPGYEVIELEV